MKLGKLRGLRLRTLSLLALALALAAIIAPASAFAAPTIVIGGPSEGASTNAATVAFPLSATTTPTQNVDFYCSLDDPSTFAPCNLVAYPTCAPNALGQLFCSQVKQFDLPAEGAHAFRAFATSCTSPCDVDTQGIDGPLVLRNFVADRTPPVATIVSGPSVAAPALLNNARFVFSATEPGIFMCAVDNDVATQCDSTMTVDGIRNGRHSLSVVARDSAGNASAAVVRSFVVDIFKPKKCKKSKSARGKAKRRSCIKANAKAKAKWKKKHRL